ncbi:MAG: hypothetical protein JSW08_01235 [archaeon]|nr:MAG: hypothetical protein JSW08_01235 [archaeon]
MKKRGQLGESMLWLYRFIIIIIVVGGVIFVVVRYYSGQNDVRPVEASLIADKILSCLDGNPNVNLKESVIGNCIKINKELFVNITFGDKNVETGNTNLGVICRSMEEGVRVENKPYCLEDNYIFLKDNQEQELNLFIALLKNEKNM